MNRVTFEMLAKWIAQQNKAKVVFDGVVQGAAANPKTDEIFMPENLKEHNILAGLALLMHEAGHLKHSKKIPEKFGERVVTRNIINAMEDIRVDLKNYDILWNIKDFYDRLIKDHVYPRKNELAKEHLLTRCLVNAILEQTYHRKFQDQEAIDFDDKHGVNNLVCQGKEAIEKSNWNRLQDIVDEIKRIFKITEQEDFKMPQPIKIGFGKIGGEGKEGEKIEGVGLGKEGKDIGNTDKYMCPASAWDKGEGIRGPSRDIIGAVAFQDLTREAFKELLSIKEKRTIYDGQRLNTDNLTAFTTGDIDELFIDSKIERIKKSKISFCLDASGSMGTPLLDNKMRTDVLVRTVRSIVDILKELQSTEGLNIKYDIWCFDYDAKKLDLDRWEKQYTTYGGGTNLLQAFLTVQDDILKDQELDGNKMVVLVTDGEVGCDEIDGLKAHIIKHGAEVKCMVIGVGADLQGRFIKTIAGDNNILAEEHSDAIVMDAIKAMLD